MGAGEDLNEIKTYRNKIVQVKTNSNKTKC